MLSSRTLSLELKKRIPQTSIVDALKIAYRPYICPFDRLLRLIPEHKKVFDVGCGSGIFLMLVGEYCKPAKLGGVEIEAELIRNAAALLSSYNVRTDLSLYDGFQFPEAMKEYDMIFLIDVFHHVPKEFQISFLENLFSVMRPGSVLVCKDIDASKKVLVIFNKLHDLIVTGAPRHEIAFGDAVRLLKEIGFNLISQDYIRRFWYPHYLIVCQKGLSV
jgi:2-polyprenyl-3-methyl-5-hydroxy-6-metoxy-1,4-benzoquinol methylase